MDPTKRIPPLAVNMGILSQPAALDSDSVLNLSSVVVDNESTKEKNDSAASTPNPIPSQHSNLDGSFNGFNAERSAFRPIVPKFVDPRSFSAVYFCSTRVGAQEASHSQPTSTDSVETGNLPQIVTSNSGLAGTAKSAEGKISQCCRDTQDLVKAVKTHFIPDSSTYQQQQQLSSHKSVTGRKSTEEFSLQKCLEGAQVTSSQTKKEKKVENFGESMSFQTVSSGWGFTPGNLSESYPVQVLSLRGLTLNSVFMKFECYTE